VKMNEIFCWFKHNLRIYVSGLVVQSVERGANNAKVTGSKPVRTSILSL
jgi:hypothetical protein